MRMESYGGMILTGENRRTRSAICHFVHGERPATNRLARPLLLTPLPLTNIGLSAFVGKPFL
jgi:hypothetical protein